MNCMKKNIKTLVIIGFFFLGFSLVAKERQQSDAVIIVDGKKTTLLHEAVRRNDVKEVENLLNQGFYVDVRNEVSCTPLHDAASYGAVDVIKLLLSRGADINAISGGFGWTPLLKAVYWNHYNAVVALAQADADLNIKADMWGVTALHKAVYHRHNKIALYLLDKGADFNSIDNLKSSPLHYTAAYSSVKVVESLIQRGANINQQSFRGQTPLHAAIECNNKVTAKCLLNAGARTDILDKDGHNAEFYVETESMKALFHPVISWYNFFL